MLRDTLRVFLQESGSFVAAAERLTLHKNTVRYRVGKAEESLGHPVGEDRLHVELALLAAQWLAPRSCGTSVPPVPEDPITTCTRRTIGGAGLVTRAQCREVTPAVASGRAQIRPGARLGPVSGGKIMSKDGKLTLAMPDRLVQAAGRTGPRPTAAGGTPQALELRHLRYFVALADAGSFTRAAENIFIAQPTLSQQIRRLEEIVGTPLLQRRREGLRLTRAGRVLLDRSRNVLALVDQEVSRTRQAAGLGRPQLRVVIPPGLPNAWRSRPRPGFSRRPRPRMWT